MNVRLIPGFTHYFASKQGRVYTNMVTSHNPTGELKEMPIRDLWEDGCPRVNLTVGKGTRKLMKVSRLIATTFIPNPHSLPCVLHRDDNPKNNNLKNLFWGTQRDNMEDKVNKGRQARGTSHGRCKLTKEDCNRIKSLANTTTKAALAKEYNVSTRTIFNVLANKNYNALCV